MLHHCGVTTVQLWVIWTVPVINVIQFFMVRLIEFPLSPLFAGFLPESIHLFKNIHETFVALILDTSNLRFSHIINSLVFNSHVAIA